MQTPIRGSSLTSMNAVQLLVWLSLTGVRAMLMRTLGVVLMLATTTFAQQVVTPNKSKPVDPTDPIMPLVDKWQAKAIVEIQLRRADGSQWEFKQPREYYSEASRKVFPEWRFLILRWEEI